MRTPVCLRDGPRGRGPNANATFARRHRRAAVKGLPEGREHPLPSPGSLQVVQLRRSSRLSRRFVLADVSQSIYLADMCGDGLADLVRIRSGEVSYWPNLGYGRFCSKVAMDNAPHFENCDQFDKRRVRLADIDGSGTTGVGGSLNVSDRVAAKAGAVPCGDLRPHLLPRRLRTRPEVKTFLTMHQCHRRAAQPRVAPPRPFPVQTIPAPLCPVACPTRSRGKGLVALGSLTTRR